MDFVMSLRSSVEKESKQASEWCEYKDEDGSVLAKFKVRGIGFKAYQVAIERISGYLQRNGDDISNLNAESKYNHEYIAEAMAHHLIADWSGVELSYDEGNTYELVKYTPENAIKLLKSKGVGVLVWSFVHENALRIQKESDAEYAEVLGK